MKKLITILASLIAVTSYAEEKVSKHQCSCGKDHHGHEVVKSVKKKMVEKKQDTKQKAVVLVKEKDLVKPSKRKQSKSDNKKTKVQKKEVKVVSLKVKESDYAVNITSSLSSEDKNLSFEFEKNFRGYSFGVMVNSAKLYDPALNVRVNNLFVGISAHYRLLDRVLGNLQYTFGPYGAFGVSFTQSTVQPELPIYPTGVFGLEHSLLLYKNVHFYNRLSSVNIFHPDSDGISLDNNFMLGVKIKF